MKKLFSISLAVCILVSCMHLTLAVHFCGGSLAAARISFTGTAATCGMETHEKNCPAYQSCLTPRCCENQKTVYAVDNNYSPSVLQFLVSPNALQPFYLALAYADILPAAFLHNSAEIPPGDFRANAVSMTLICSLRI